MLHQPKNNKPESSSGAAKPKSNQYIQDLLTNHMHQFVTYARRLHQISHLNQEIGRLGKHEPIEENAKEQAIRYQVYEFESKSKQRFARREIWSERSQI